MQVLKTTVILTLVIGAFVSIVVRIFDRPSAEDDEEVFDAEGLHGPKDSPSEQRAKP